MTAIGRILADQPNHYWPCDDGGAGTTIANLITPARTLTTTGGNLASTENLFGRIHTGRAADTGLAIADTTVGYCMAGWFNATTLVNNNGIFGCWNGSGQFMTGTSATTIAVYHGGTSISIDVTGLFGSANQWCHLVNLWDGTTQYALVNGVVKNSRVIGSPGTPTNVLELGSYNANSGTYPTLKAAHLAYWSKVGMAANPMTVAKVKVQYEAGLRYGVAAG